jgi:predicted nucleic acid-binding protein/GNAT superfamily N-acetyltransferase
VSVVSNSSPLIALAQIQRLDLVPAILQSVLIPPAVVREIAPSIPVLPQWATVRVPKSRPSVLTSPGRLGDGEREAIALAMEVGAVAIVLDDRPARRAAEAAGLNVIGTLGLLLEAKRKGLVTRVRVEIDKLVATSFFLSRPLYERLLEMAGESDAVGVGDRSTKAFDIRQAERSDVDEIAAAHRDSIQSIGPAYYSDEVVAWWQEAIEGQLYLKAMDGGEVFFIAVGDVDGRRAVLGFASDYCIEGEKHGTSVYVRGRSARQGIGSALLAKAEAHAIETGATSIEIEASLAGVDFYRANGFIEVGRGETRLTTARSMECVFMRKELSAVTP